LNDLQHPHRAVDRYVTRTGDGDERISLDALEPILDLARDFDAVIVGPGLGREVPTRKLVKRLVKSLESRIVLDADGLNAFAGAPARLDKTKADLVLTPHPGELGRILGTSASAIQKDREGAVELLGIHAPRAVLVLKGAGSIVARHTPRRMAVNETGNPGMATAGAGDVLSGIVATLLAQKMDPWEAARLAVWLHGRAGDLVEGRRRFRLVLAIAAAVAIAGITLFSALAGPQSRAYASIITVAITLVLAIGGAMLGLGIRTWSGLVNEPAAGGGNPTGPAAAAAIAIDPEERVLLDRLQRLMEEARIYREEGLSIASLASRLGLPEYRLRRLINQRLGHRNFTSFVNGYRLAETIAALSDTGQAQVPILTIALDAGFQSIGPFNRAFKAQTGMTPSDFRRDHMARDAQQAAE